MSMELINWTSGYATAAQMNNRMTLSEVVAIGNWSKWSGNYQKHCKYTFVLLGSLQQLHVSRNIIFLTDMLWLQSWENTLMYMFRKDAQPLPGWITGWPVA